MKIKDKIEKIIELSEIDDFSVKARYYVYGLEFIKSETQALMQIGTTGAGNKILEKSIKDIDETIEIFRKRIVELSKEYPDHVKIDLFERGGDVKKQMGIGTGLPNTIIPETEAALNNVLSIIDSKISDPKLLPRPKNIIEFGYKIGAARATSTNVSLSDRGKETGFIRNKLVYQFLEKQAQLLNKADRELNNYS